MQNNWSKSKRLHKKSQFNSSKIGWNTSMAAVLFFCKFKVAALKSCQNVLYNDHHLHIECIYTSSVILYCIPFRCVRLSVNGALSHVIPRNTWNSYSVEQSVLIFSRLVFSSVMFNVVHSFTPCRL